MRDMNADRASMMKNRPLRKRDEDRECARALNQRNRDAQWFRDTRNDGSNRTPQVTLRKTPLQSQHCCHRRFPFTYSMYSKNAP